MEKLTVDELGFCCVYGYFTDVENEAKDNKTLAQRLGVTERTIRWHKQRIREGCTTCEHQLRCQIKPIITDRA
jgi:hypothetical protein